MTTIETTTRAVEPAAPPRRRRRLRRAIARLVLLAILAVGSIVGWNFATGNFAAVRPGEVYRSAQLGPDSLARTIRRYGIKTVLNLRGAHPESSGYRAERAATLANGATQVDIALSSAEWMSRVQMQALIDTLETCERPLLIHCWRGAERTGLTSAFTELLRPDGSLDRARAQFSLRYLFIRAGDGALMPEHLDQYADWLRRNRLDHSPALFRRWVAEGYHPGKPNREDWPFDPYPLLVVTRPGGEERNQENLPQRHRGHREEEEKN